VELTPPPPSGAEVLERVEIYFYSLYGPACPIKRGETYQVVPTIREPTYKLRLTVLS